MGLGFRSEIGSEIEVRVMVMVRVRDGARVRV